jgi:hypothetical protein
LTVLLIVLLACGWYTVGFTIITLIWAAPAAIIHLILITICEEWGRQEAMARYRDNQEIEHRRRQEDRWNIEDQHLEQDRSRQEEVGDRKRALGAGTRLADTTLGGGWRRP